MEMLSLAAAVVALAIVVLVVFLIPVVVELRKTVKSLRRFIEQSETNIEPALTEVREVLAGLKVITEATASRADEVKSIITALGDTGENIHRINGAISGAMGILGKPASYWTGARAAGKYILDRMKKKGG